MKGILNKKEPGVLFLGDMLMFSVSLWISLLIRYGTIPEINIFFDNLIPFGILFIIWTLSFFIAGLYETHRVIIRNRLPEILFKTQMVNIAIAIIFFYFFAVFGITPKTILFIYVIVSLLLIVVWRIVALLFFVVNKKSKAVLIGSGKDTDLLFEEINKSSRYNFEFCLKVKPESLTSVDFEKEILDSIYSEDVRIIVIDSTNEKLAPYLPHFYNLIFSNVQFVDFYKLYGEIFYKYPVGLLNYGWFIQNISLTKYGIYDLSKRFMDIIVSLIFGIISLVFYPFIILALSIEGGGIFIKQNRVGQNNKVIKIIKFRTMAYNDNGVYNSENKNYVTKIGGFLRKSRLDELPQLWNVFVGDLSLIGPRPELEDLVKKYSDVIPYYNVRHIIKPGLSGWAQIYHFEHPHHGIDVEETINKLSYDLFYIKNRSIILDIMIALKTIKTLLSREGK